MASVICSSKREWSTTAAQPASSSRLMVSRRYPKGDAPAMKGWGNRNPRYDVSVCRAAAVVSIIRSLSRPDFTGGCCRLHAMRTCRPVACIRDAGVLECGIYRAAGELLRRRVQRLNLEGVAHKGQHATPVEHHEPREQRDASRDPERHGRHITDRDRRQPPAIEQFEYERVRSGNPEKRELVVERDVLHVLLGRADEEQQARDQIDR